MNLLPIIFSIVIFYSAGDDNNLKPSIANRPQLPLPAPRKNQSSQKLSSNNNTLSCTTKKHKGKTKNLNSETTPANLARAILNNLNIFSKLSCIIVFRINMNMN